MGKDLDKLNERAESAFERIRRERFGVNFEKSLTKTALTPVHIEKTKEEVLKSKAEKQIEEANNLYGQRHSQNLQEELAKDCQKYPFSSEYGHSDVFDILDYLDSSSLSDNIKAAIGILLANKGKEDIEKAILYLDKELKK